MCKRLERLKQRKDLQETTGWTPLHFAVSKAHYSIILQLLQHQDTDVNQAKTQPGCKSLGPR